ncbi:hypothetical protein ACV56Z_00680 [Staphylococcus aureus]
MTYAGYDIDDLAKMRNLKKLFSYYGTIDCQNEEELAHLKGKLNQYMTLNPRVYYAF